MRIYVGSVLATECTVTFSFPYVQAPICILNTEIGSLAFEPTASSTATKLLIGGGTITSTVLTAHCEGIR